LVARLIGYARVSTNGQTLDAQVEMLETAGAEMIFQETASGARTNRAQLAKAIGALRTGDTLIVTRLDRLARSTRDLLNRLDAVARKGTTFRSPADAWADTTTAHGRLLLTVLGGLAEFERELIRVRTGEGRRRAVEAGVKLGRRSSLTTYQQAEVLKRRASARPSKTWRSRVKNSCGDEACEEVVIPSGDLAAEAEGIFARRSADQVEGHVLDGGEVCGCVLGADAAFVVAEIHVQDPVQAVLNHPMGSDGRPELSCDPQQ